MPTLITFQDFTVTSLLKLRKIALNIGKLSPQRRFFLQLAAQFTLTFTQLQELVISLTPLFLPFKFANTLVNNTKQAQRIICKFFYLFLTKHNGRKTLMRITKIINPIPILPL